MEAISAHSLQEGFKADLDLLRKQVASWSLQALVLTERPRELWHYSLPLLTCLYRVLNMPDWATKKHHNENSFRLVADVDFRFVFYPELVSTLGQMEGLRDWLDKQCDEQGSAQDLRALLEWLQKQGVQVGMNVDVADAVSRSSM